MLPKTLRLVQNVVRIAVIVPIPLGLQIEVVNPVQIVVVNIDQSDPGSKTQNASSMNLRVFGHHPHVYFRNWFLSHI